MSPDLDAIRVTSVGPDVSPRVAIAGEIDLATAPILYRRLGDLIERGASELVLDFTDVRFLDSSGLGVLVRVLKQVERRGGHVTISHPSDNVRKVFEITGLCDAFGIPAV